MATLGLLAIVAAGVLAAVPQRQSPRTAGRRAPTRASTTGWASVRMFARIALSGLGGALAGLVANASAATMASLPGTPDGIFTVVGEALPGSDLLPFGSPATSIRLGSDDTQPQAVLALPDNAMLVALGTRILRVDRRGLVHRYAGTGSVGWGGDGGSALRARFGEIRDLARLADGTVLVVDDANSDVRAIDPHGRISTVVARGAHLDGGFRGDGRPAVAALLCFPTALSAEPQGRYLIADLCNHRVREVTPDGRIATVAGNGAKGHDGDGGPASAAGIGSPTAVAAMPDGGPH
jgi:hypothetical protein